MIFSHHRGNVDQRNFYFKTQKPTSLNKMKLAVGLNPDSFKPLFIYLVSSCIIIFSIKHAVIKEGRWS